MAAIKQVNCHDLEEDRKLGEPANRYPKVRRVCLRENVLFQDMNRNVNLQWLFFLIFYNLGLNPS